MVAPTTNRAVAILGELLEEGRNIALSLDTGGIPPPAPQYKALAWASSVVARLEEVFGAGNARFQGFVSVTELPGFTGSGIFGYALMRLEAAIRDLEQGPLSGVEGFVAGEVFGDFLEMAQHLSDQGAPYHVAAASVAGAVLEDGLRRLCKANSRTWVGDSSVSKLNDLLHKYQMYDQVTWRQIQVWGDVRNKADHGEFENVDAGAVASMIPGVREFLFRFPA
jgi:hypothetical protein